jgi:hypothetical protein
MALWAVAFMGSTPVGGPLIGWVVEAAGARAGIAVGAVSCFAAAGIGVFAIRHVGIGEVSTRFAPPVPVPLVAAEAD